MNTQMCILCIAFLVYIFHKSALPDNRKRVLCEDVTSILNVKQNRVGFDTFIVIFLLLGNKVWGRGWEGGG